MTKDFKILITLYLLSVIPEASYAQMSWFPSIVTGIERTRHFKDSIMSGKKEVTFSGSSGEALKILRGQHGLFYKLPTGERIADPVVQISYSLKNQGEKIPYKIDSRENIEKSLYIGFPGEEREMVLTAGQYNNLLKADAEITNGYRFFYDGEKRLKQFNIRTESGHNLDMFREMDGSYALEFGKSNLPKGELRMNASSKDFMPKLDTTRDGFNFTDATLTIPKGAEIINANYSANQISGANELTLILRRKDGHVGNVKIEWNTVKESTRDQKYEKATSIQTQDGVA